MKHTFQLGDRVITTHRLPGIRRGMCGTIALVYGGATGIYDVHFGDKGLIRLVCAEVLEPVVAPAAIAKCNSQAQRPDLAARRTPLLE